MLIKKMKHGLVAILAAALVLQGMPAPAPAAAQEAGVAAQTEAVHKQASGVNVAYRTQDEIRNYIAESGAAFTDSVTFQTEPVIKAPYALGKLSDETLESAIKMLNQIRYIAGIPYDVELDGAYIEKAQAASLVNYVNNKMTHYPEKPDDMPNEIYELGEEGAGSSNIAWGSGTSWKLNYFIALSWMEDGDESNIDRVGHRRWLLNPSMKKTGFGLVKGDNGTHCAVYAFDRSGGSGEYGVMWPAQNMPTDYFNSRFPWSVSMGSTVDDSTVKVTLTRVSDGQVWNFSKASADGPFYVNNDGYGQEGCIIFRPDGVTEYKDGDSYEVNITGLSGEDVSYCVNFFDLVPEELEPTPEVKSVSVFPGAASVEAGASQKFTEFVSVLNGADASVFWSVSGNTSSGTSISKNGLLAVAGDEAALTLTVRATSIADESKYAEASVTVTPKTEDDGIETPSGDGAGTSSGDSTETPSGGGTGTPSGGSTETPSGGGAGTPSGDSTETPSGDGIGTPSGGSTETPSGGGTGTPSDGDTESPSGDGAEDKDHELIAKEMILSETSYVYNGKDKKPVVTVIDNRGDKISSAYYTVTYSNNKKVGKATVTVKLKNGYSGTLKKNFTIKPKGTTLSSLAGTSNCISIKWIKQKTQTTGYQLQYSTGSRFSKKVTVTKTVKNNAATKLTEGKLKAKKTYYVRIRTYKTVNGKKYYSVWSKVMKVRTK